MEVLLEKAKLADERIAKLKELVTKIGKSSLLTYEFENYFHFLSKAQSIQASNFDLSKKKINDWKPEFKVLFKN